MLERVRTSGGERKSIEKEYSEREKKKIQILIRSHREGHFFFLAGIALLNRYAY